MNIISKKMLTKQCIFFLVLKMQGLKNSDENIIIIL